MRYAGDPIPANPPAELGYRTGRDPYNPERFWVIYRTTRFGTERVRHGRSRLTLRWYLLWYRTVQPIGPWTS